MGSVIGFFLFIGGFVVFCYTAKWVFAVITILCGNKDYLHDFGNLCEKNIPISDRFFSPVWGDDMPEPPQKNWRNKGEGNML